MKPTHPKQMKAALKQAVNPTATTEGDAPVVIDWTDVNRDLRRRYGVAEKRLAAARKKGDRRAQRRYKRELDDIGREFVQTNIGLVEKQVRRFKRNVTDDQDNRSAGMQGLWEAFLRYDVNRPAAFSTFSHQHIAGGIQREVRRNEFQHLSQNEFNLRKQVRLAQAQLAALLGRQATVEELSEKTGLSLEKVEKVLTPSASSLDETVGEDGLKRLDLLESDILDIESDEDLEKYLDALSDLELWVLLQRGGFLGPIGFSLVETADGIGIGREVARRAESRARIRVASSVLTDRLGVLPSPEEVATLLGVDTDHVEEYSTVSWEDLRARWDRASRKLSAASSSEEAESLAKTLDLIGREFIENSVKIIHETGARYLDENGFPIGAIRAAREAFVAFTEWDYREETFPVHLRSTLVARFRRARTSSLIESVDTEDLWYVVKNHATLAPTLW
jgi:DNA-directed RNA polymerase specialized sigma subunit